MPLTIPYTEDAIKELPKGRATAYGFRFVVRINDSNDRDAEVFFLLADQNPPAREFLEQMSEVVEKDFTEQNKGQPMDGPLFIKAKVPLDQITFEQ